MFLIRRRRKIYIFTEVTMDGKMFLEQGLEK
jgi:hypothetical protein